MDIAYKPTFIRQFNKLESALQDEIHETILELQKTPPPESLRVHKLTGKLKGFLSCSVNYKYRIVFQKVKKEYILHSVGDHDVYR